MRIGTLLCAAALLGGGLAGTANAGSERLLPTEPMLTRLVHQYAQAAAYAERCDGVSRERTMRDVMALFDAYFPSRRVWRVAPHLHAIVDHIQPDDCSGEVVEEHLSGAFELYEEAVRVIRDSYGY